jgi:hypothetical protein
MTRRPAGGQLSLPLRLGRLCDATRRSSRQRPPRLCPLDPRSSHQPVHRPATRAHRPATWQARRRPSKWAGSSSPRAHTRVLGSRLRHRHRLTPARTGSVMTPIPAILGFWLGRFPSMKTAPAIRLRLHQPTMLRRLATTASTRRRPTLRLSWCRCCRPRSWTTSARPI